MWGRKLGEMNDAPAPVPCDLPGDGQGCNIPAGSDRCYRESFRPAAFLEMFGQEEDTHSLGSQ